MAEKKQTLVTPVGVAAYAWVDKPDTGKEYSDDKYKVTLCLEKGNADVEKFVKKIDALHVKARGKKKTESPVKDGDLKEKEEFEGKHLLTFKSKFPPGVVDKHKEPLPEGQTVFSGDLIRVAFTVNEYEKGANAGVSLQLKAIQMIEKRNKGGGGGTEAFDEYDDGDATEGGDDDGNEDF